MDALEFQRLTGASDAALSDLELYRQKLEAGNAVMNLVGPASLPDFWNRHALDSAQLLQMAPEARIWADLGAGAGLPGVVLAILLKATPEARVWLIDSQTKRCRFLSDVVSDLSLPADVINARAESLSIKVDVVTARACAPLDRLLQFAEPYRRHGAEALFLKGEKAEEEIAEARRHHRFDAEVLPSASDPRGRILRIRSRQVAA
ncbi:MAG: 16S rRNA (guanine(527)-N(7))-methyltransferase RsmG [Caulobacterales bacterium]|nr:16S rRNA (guanine(527)-N(7))-methyltransferase RsmG [Caulobacterales bacterium]